MGETARGASLTSLTGLRYLAAALVVFHHIAPVLAPGGLTEQLSSAGYAGVTFFFILSGFVLTWSKRPSISVGAFYQNRFARVYPLYIATWVAAVGTSAFLHEDKPVLGILLSLLLLQAWVPNPLIYGAGNSPGWSLSAEAFFYLCFPFLVGRWLRLDERTRLLLPFTAVVVLGGSAYALTPAYSHWLAYYSPIYNLLSFILGILLAGWMKRGGRLRIPVSASLAIVVATYVLVALPAGIPRGLADALLTAPAVLLIASAATADLAGKRSPWNSRVAELLGKWSFALYLVHYMMARLTERLLPPIEWSIWPRLGLMLLFLGVATAISAAAHYVIEEPLQRRLRARTTTPEPRILAADPM